MGKKLTSGTINYINLTNLSELLKICNTLGVASDGTNAKNEISRDTTETQKLSS